MSYESYIFLELAKWGAETIQTRERFLDDSAFYMECLNTFVQSNDSSKLFHAIRKKDYAAAYDIASDLKGVTANMGLIPLYDPLCEIILAIRENSYDSLIKYYSEFDSAFKRFRLIVQSK